MPNILLVENVEPLSDNMFAVGTDKFKEICNKAYRIYGINELSDLCSGIEKITADMKTNSCKLATGYVYAHAFEDTEYNKHRKSPYCDDARSYIKVGHSMNVKQRLGIIMQELKYNFPGESLRYKETILILPCLYPSSSEYLESKILCSLGKYHVRGEYFHDCLGSFSILMHWYLMAKLQFVEKYSQTSKV